MRIWRFDLIKVVELYRANVKIPHSNDYKIGELPDKQNFSRNGKS